MDFLERAGETVLHEIFGGNNIAGQNARIPRQARH
jgi:hypothetical protein